MKKGLNVTLMTVAFAMLCMQTMAMAPVISDIQSPVIGNEGVTGSNTYLWADAINLDANVNDPDGTDNAVLWSYYIAGTPTYRLNNVDSLTLAEAGNPTVVNAPGAKRLDGTTVDPADVSPADGLSNTVTIRNVKYTPVGGPNVAPSGTGLIDEQAVTLFASDGTTYSALGKTILFYTEVGGSDHFGTTLTPPTGTGTPLNLPALPTGWSFNTGLTFGTVTSSIVSNTICLETPLTGSHFNVNGWYTNFGYIQLVANNVYKFHLKVNGNQATGVTVPFWDVVVNNFDGTNGLNVYGADYYFLDNEDGDSSSSTNGHGANAPNTAGRDYYIYWCPTPLTTAQWNNSTTGVFATSVGNNKNGYLMFRVLDTNNPAITPDLDGGRICLSQIDGTRYDLSTMTTVQSNVYASPTTMSASNMQAVPIFSTITWPSGALNMDLPSGAAESEIVNVWPGDATLSISTPSSYDDNFPIPWVNNELFMITAELSAPTTADETHPYDVFWVSMDTATNEFIAENFVTYKQNFCAMPKTGTAQVYRSFFYSHNQSLTPITNLRRLRPRFYAGNSTTMNDKVLSDGTIVPASNTSGQAMNSGALRLHSLKVDKVSFPN